MTPHPLLAIALGGAIGAVLRYAAVRLLTLWHGAEAAWSTLAVNVTGSFALGLAAGLITDRAGPFAAFLMVGVLGAFTTFSTFALDAVTLHSARGLMVAGLHVLLSVGLSIIAAIAGLALARGIA